MHDGSQEQDEARDHVLVSFGLRVLRLRNDEVLTDIDAVGARIDAALKTSPLPLSARGEGFGER